MSLTCLQIVQRACGRIGIPSPNAAVSSSDPQIQQLLELSNEEGQELALRYPWQALQGSATFTTLAADAQTPMLAVTSGFARFVNDSMWNRTLNEPVTGPVSPQDWQMRLASSYTGPYSAFRIFADVIYFNPAPTAGQSIFFEYLSSWWVQNTGSSALVGENWTLDTNTSALNDQLMVLGLVWRWKQAKGLTYAEDFDKYERRLEKLMLADGGKPKLNMGSGGGNAVPGVFVAAGSWTP